MCLSNPGNDSSFKISANQGEYSVFCKLLNQGVSIEIITNPFLSLIAAKEKATWVVLLVLLFGFCVEPNLKQTFLKQSSLKPIF